MSEGSRTGTTFYIFHFFLVEEIVRQGFEERSGCSSSTTTTKLGYLVCLRTCTRVRFGVCELLRCRIRSRRDFSSSYRHTAKRHRMVNPKGFGSPNSRIPTPFSRRIIISPSPALMEAKRQWIRGGSSCQERKMMR